MKEVINRGGDKMSADEVEEHLRSYPGITDAAVIAVPHDLLGEQVCVCVIA